MYPSLKPFTAAVLAAIALAATGASFAQPAPPPPVPDNAGSARPLATGRVQTLLVNPGGDVDGLLLDDGTQVAFPPQTAAGLALKPGDRVQVSGWPGTRAQLLRADRITTAAGSRSLSRPPPAEGAPPPARPRPENLPALTAMSTSGKVSRLLYTDRGDTNGALLDNGTILRFPPMAGDAASAAMPPGRTLFATGWGSRTAAGTAMEATAIGPSLTAMQELMPRPRPPEPNPRGPMPPPGATPPPAP